MGRTSGCKIARRVVHLDTRTESNSGRTVAQFSHRRALFDILHFRIYRRVHKNKKSRAVNFLGGRGNSSLFFPFSPLAVPAGLLVSLVDDIANRIRQHDVERQSLITLHGPHELNH